MHPKRKKHLIILLSMLAGLAIIVGLVLFAIREQTDYFYAPSDIQAGKANGKARIKAGGMVVAGSIVRQGLTVNFKITDFQAVTPVQYTGILPDLFKEGSGMVGTGKMENGLFVAEEILAKHDENYMPPDVAKTLKKNNSMPTGQY